MSFALVAFAATLGCGPQITNPFGDQGRLTQIQVSGPPTVRVGDTVRFTAIGNVSGVLGIFELDRLTDAAWSVSDPSLAQVTPIPITPNDTTSYAQALVRGVSVGTVQVIVNARGVSSSHPLAIATGP